MATLARATAISTLMLLAVASGDKSVGVDADTTYLIQMKVAPQAEEPLDKNCLEETVDLAHQVLKVCETHQIIAECVSRSGIRPGKDCRGDPARFVTKELTHVVTEEKAAAHADHWHDVYKQCHKFGKALACEMASTTLHKPVLKEVQDELFEKVKACPDIPWTERFEEMTCSSESDEPSMSPKLRDVVMKTIVPQMEESDLSHSAPLRRIVEWLDPEYQLPVDLSMERDALTEAAEKGVTPEDLITDEAAGSNTHDDIAPPVKNEEDDTNEERPAGEDKDDAEDAGTDGDDAGTDGEDAEDAQGDNGDDAETADY